MPLRLPPTPAGATAACAAAAPVAAAAARAGRAQTCALHTCRYGVPYITAIAKCLPFSHAFARQQRVHTALLRQGRRGVCQVTLTLPFTLGNNVRASLLCQGGRGVCAGTFAAAAAAAYFPGRQHRRPRAAPLCQQVHPGRLAAAGAAQALPGLHAQLHHIGEHCWPEWPCTYL